MDPEGDQLPISELALDEAMGRELVASGHVVRAVLRELDHLVVAMQPADPDTLLASRFGYVCVSDDARDNWGKLPREFDDVDSIALAPL